MKIKINKYIEEKFIHIWSRVQQINDYMIHILLRTFTSGAVT